MMPIFYLPKDQVINTYNLITSQVKQNLPLNVGLIFNKYVNKYITGYLDNEKWKEGMQSEIKRQIFLLRKERIDVLEEIKQIMESKGEAFLKIGKERRKLREFLEPIVEALQNCDLDNAIDGLSKITRSKEMPEVNISEKIQRCLSMLSRTKLSLSRSAFSEDLYKAFFNRMRFVLDDLKKQGFFIEEETLKLSWRLVVNLGATSVYETSLLFHRNYSIPYIPGSAVKGVANHYAIILKEEGKVTNEEYIRIFGDQNKKGEVIFFDALPVLDDENKDFVVLDVMNVHYREYYQDESGRTPPGDWMNPNPVFFLAVEKGTRFRFCVASRNQKLAKKAMELLREAVVKIGIGAKTSAGYGYFEI